jgi:hypothetical protein
VQAVRRSAHLLPHLATDVSETLLSIEALSLKPAVPKHFRHLCVLLAVFTKNELTLVVIVLIFSSSTVFATLEVN